MVISDDEDDSNKKKKDVVNGNKEDKQNDCDAKKDKDNSGSDQDTGNTQVKRYSEGKEVKVEGGAGDSNNKSVVARNNAKQQQLSIDCNVIEKLDGGEMISNGVYGSTPDSPNTQKLKSEALANVRGAKVSLQCCSSFTLRETDSDTTWIGS